MPQDTIGSLYSKALKGSLKSLPNQVNNGLLKQTFDNAIKGTSKTTPLMETVPAPTVIKTVSETQPEAVVESLDTVEVVVPEVTVKPTVKTVTKTPQSGSLV